MKKIIVFSHNCFSKTQNNGKTLSAIFGSIGKNRIAQLFISTREMPSSDGVADKYFLISDRDLVNSAIHHRPFGHEIVGTGSEAGIRNNSHSHKPLGRRNIITIWLREIVWLILFRFKSKHLLSWIKEQDPGVLFYLSGDAIFSQSVTRYLVSELNLPILVYVTDDYLVYNKPRLTSPLKWLHHRFLSKSARKLFNNSENVFVISERMKEVYDDKYQITSTILRNTVPFLPFSYNKAIRDGSVVTIGYYGSLALGRDEQLISLANLLREIDLPQEVKVILDVYTFSPTTSKTIRKFDESGIILHNGLNQEKMKSSIKEHDILLLVESDKRRYTNLTMLSFSTKITEYMIMSRPILAYGPSEIGSMYFITENGCGVHVNSRSPSRDQILQVHNLISSSNFREELARKAYEVAIRKFDPEDQSDKFQTIINKHI